MKYRVVRQPQSDRLLRAGCGSCVPRWTVSVIAPFGQVLVCAGRAIASCLPKYPPGPGTPLPSVRSLTPSPASVSASSVAACVKL